MPRPRILSDEQVLAAVARVLLRLGPRFTLADAGAEAGLSPATLLQRFGSKRGLLLAFARAAAADAEGPFERARAERKSPLGALELALVGGAHYCVGAKKWPIAWRSCSTTSPTKSCARQRSSMHGRRRRRSAPC